MTTAPPAPAAPAELEQRPAPPRPWLTALVVVLLIAIPLGYLAISAVQSRDSGQDKQRTAALRELTYQWPSRVQRRIYEVPVPLGSTYVAYLETNSWRTDSLYVQFNTSQADLDTFLKEVGTDRSALRSGEVTITGEQADRAGWNFGTPGHSYAGTVLRHLGSAPDLAVTVDFARTDRPRVHVVSTADF